MVSFFRNLVGRASASRDDINALEEQATAKAEGTIPIGKVKARQKVRLSGTLQALTFHPATQGPRLSALLYDGSGSIELVWMGRKEIPGIEPGKHLIVEGTVLSSAGRLRMMNPAYRIRHSEGSNA